MNVMRRVMYAASSVKAVSESDGKVVLSNYGVQKTMESFQSEQLKAFKGFCLAVVQSNTAKGRISITATADGLVSSSIVYRQISY